MVQANIGARTDQDTQIYRMLNVAQQHVVSMGLAFGHEWKSLQTLTTSGATVASTRASALPTGCAGVYSVRMIIDNDSRTLTYDPPRTTDREHPYPEDDAGSKPTNYTIWGNYFYWRPVPDAVYTYHVRHVSWPSDISAGTTTEPIARSGGVLVAYASAMMFAQFENQESSALWFTIADGGSTLAAGKRKPSGLLGALLRGEGYAADWRGSPREFRTAPALVAGEPWNDPFVGLS